VTVASGQFVDVPFTLKVPSGATSGDHTGGIVTSVTTPATGVDRRPVLLDRRLGSRVQVRVRGPVRPGLAITDLRTDYDDSLNPFGKGTLHVTYTVRNRGNVRLTATPTITVEGGFGITTATLRGSRTPELLPSSALTFTADVEVWPALRLETTVALTARAAAGRPPLPIAARAASASTTTWAVPWTLVVALVVLVVGPLSWRWSRRRRARRLDTMVRQAVAQALDLRESRADDGSGAEVIDLVRETKGDEQTTRR
jgi:hypothetical protein